jgi:hypothetical protein
LRKEAGFTPAFFLEDAEDVGRGPESGSRTGFAAGDRRAKKIKFGQCATCRINQLLCCCRLMDNEYA